MDLLMFNSSFALKKKIILPPSSYPSFLKINFRFYSDSKKGRRKYLLELDSGKRHQRSKTLKLEK